MPEIYEIVQPDGRVSGWTGKSAKRTPLGFGLPPEAEPGELYVQVYEPDRDDWGRVKFFMFWHDAGLPALGPADGSYTGTTRGQVFSADERPRICEALERGDRVYLWPSGEEVTADA